MHTTNESIAEILRWMSFGSIRPYPDLPLQRVCEDLCHSLYSHYDTMEEKLVTIFNSARTLAESEDVPSLYELLKLKQQDVRPGHVFLTPEEETFIDRKHFQTKQTLVFEAEQLRLSQMYFLYCMMQVSENEPCSMLCQVLSGQAEAEDLHTIYNRLLVSVLMGIQQAGGELFPPLKETMEKIPCR